MSTFLYSSFILIKFQFRRTTFQIVYFASFAQTARSILSFLQFFGLRTEFFDVTSLIAQPANLVFLERFAFVAGFQHAPRTR
jgi:hypothetical protein